MVLFMSAFFNSSFSVYVKMHARKDESESICDHAAITTLCVAWKLYLYSVYKLKIRLKYINFENDDCKDVFVVFDVLNIAKISLVLHLLTMCIMQIILASVTVSNKIHNSMKTTRLKESENALQNV